MAIIINRNTAIQGEITPVVRRAVSALRRDMDKVFKRRMEILRCMPEMIWDLFMESMKSAAAC